MDRDRIAMDDAILQRVRSAFGILDRERMSRRAAGHLCPSRFLTPPLVCSLFLLSRTRRHLSLARHLSIEELKRMPP